MWIRYLKAYVGMILITATVFVLGFAFCLGSILATVALFGEESQAVKMVAMIMIGPALVTFLLGLGLGNRHFHKRMEEGVDDGAT